MASTDQASRVMAEFRKVVASVVLFNDKATQHTGMTASEAQFVHLLELHGPMTPSQLSARTGLTSGAVTGVLDRLEALAFIHRERHPSDRRKVLAVLHPDQVAQKLAPLFAEQGRALEEAVAQFTGREQAIIARFLETLNKQS